MVTSVAAPRAKPNSIPMQHREQQRHALVVEPPHDERRQRAHLALGEVEVPRAAVDDDEGEGDESVDRAGGQAEEEGFEEPVHQYPRYALRMLSSAAIVSASPEATILPVSSR